MTRSALISDQVHNRGVPGFFWLPPIAPTTTYGTFKPGLAPVVTIEQLPLGTRPPIATYSMTSGSFGVTVKTDGVSHYMVNWDTKLFDLNPSLTYRIRVVLENFELGFADLDVVSSGSELRNVATSEFIPLLDGRTLPVKFRIEPDALKCVGVYCRALDQCHDAGVCDPFTGQCSNPAKADGVACNDGNACTQSDACQAGACVGSSPVVCTALDQCHDAGTCDLATGQCSQPARPDGTACDDGSACTRTDTCQAGACIGSNPVTCVASDVCHVGGSCDPATGECTDLPLNCDDGDACTYDGCELPQAEFAGGCVHARSTGPGCATTCLYDPPSNTTTCTPTSYDDVSIIASSLVGGPFHANQDVKVSVTLESASAHEGYPVEVTMLQVTYPSAADPREGAVIARTAVRIGAAGRAEYWIDAHIPAGLALGNYVLLVHRYPDGEFVGSTDVAAAYDLTAPDPGLPVLDLARYFAGQRALLVDPASTVDPQAPAVYRQTPFSGTIDVVARNYPVTEAPLTAHLNWNGGSIPLLFWDPSQHRYAATLLVGGPGHELQPDVPRSQYLQLAISETDAAALRGQLAAGPVSTQVVIVVNADASVAEAPCIPPVSGPATCSHSLSANAIVALAPPPAALAPSAMRQAAVPSPSMLGSYAGATPPLRFETPTYSTVPESAYVGAGATFGGWIQFSNAGLESHVLVEFPVKMFGRTFDIQKVEINASAHRDSLAHVDYVLTQAGSVIYDYAHPFNIDKTAINESLPFPSYSSGWGFDQRFWIFWVPVKLTAGVDLSIGLSANIIAQQGRSLSVSVAPSASATGYLAASVDVFIAEAGAEGRVTLVGATLDVKQSGSFTIRDDPALPGHQYLLGTLDESMHYEIDSLDGSLDLFIKYWTPAWCKSYGLYYPCLQQAKDTLPICSWTGFHEGADLIKPVHQSDYRINLPYTYPANYCSIPLGNEQRCGLLPEDDSGVPRDCGPCPAGYACSMTENVCKVAARTIAFATPTANSGPFEIAAGPDGNLWFTEWIANKIGRINPSTGDIAEFAIPTPESNPRGIAAGPDGNIWFTEMLGDKIGRIEPSTGNITEFPLATLSIPFGIAAGPDGNVWFTENGKQKVGRITPGGVINEFAIHGFSPDYRCAYTPGAIAAGPDGNLWFTEFSYCSYNDSYRLSRITQGGVVTDFEVPGEPYSITAGPDGNMWFTENANKIGRITPSGTLTEFATPSGLSPLLIAPGPDGNLWFTYEAINLIGRITPDGRIAEFAIPAQYPFGVAAGPDQNVWFTDRLGSAVGRIIP